MSCLAVMIVDPSRAKGQPGPVDVRRPGVVAVPSGDPTCLARWLSAAQEVTHVVVLSRPEMGRRARLLATVASGQHPSVAVTVHVEDASQVALVAAAHRALESPCEPGVGYDRIRQILATTVSGALVASVTKLNRPRPSFGQHLRSILPGGQGFVAYHGGSVVNATELSSRHPHGAGDVVVAAGAPDELARLGGLVQRQVLPAATVGDPKTVYGHAATEFAQLGVTQADPGRECPVCQERSSASVCPFCRVVIDRESVPAQ